MKKNNKNMINGQFTIADLIPGFDWGDSAPVKTDTAPPYPTIKEEPMIIFPRKGFTADAEYNFWMKQAKKVRVRNRNAYADYDIDIDDE